MLFRSDWQGEYPVRNEVWGALEDDLRCPVRSRFGTQIERLRREGLAELDGATLRLTEAGLDLHSEVALQFF